MDNKRRLYRLIEKYLNDVKKDAVELFYGEGSTIKIHTINFGITNNTILIEGIVILGNSINENVVDNSLAEVLIRESMVYFFPEHQIKTYIRFDI
jgi:hypothetical protein